MLGATGPQNLRQHVEQRQAGAETLWARPQALLDGFTAQCVIRQMMALQPNALGVRAAGGWPWSQGQPQRVFDALQGQRVESGGEPVAA